MVILENKQFKRFNLLKASPSGKGVGGGKMKHGKDTNVVLVVFTYQKYEDPKVFSFTVLFKCGGVNIKIEMVF